MFSDASNALKLSITVSIFKLSPDFYPHKSDTTDFGCFGAFLVLTENFIAVRVELQGVFHIA